MIESFGTFTRSLDGSIMVFTNEDGVDWYELVREHVAWDDRGNPISLPDHPWLTVKDGVVQHVEADPSRLVPIDCEVLSTDLPVSPGMLYSGGDHFEPAPPPPTKVQVLDALTLWERAEDSEAVAIEAAMAQQSAKIRNIFRTANSFRSDHPLWPMLHQVAEALFGSARAAVLLTPDREE